MLVIVIILSFKLKYLEKLNYSRPHFSIRFTVFFLTQGEKYIYNTLKSTGNLYYVLLFLFSEKLEWQE